SPALDVVPFPSQGLLGLGAFWRAARPSVDLGEDQVAFLVHLIGIIKGVPIPGGVLLFHLEPIGIDRLRQRVHVPICPAESNPNLSGGDHVDLSSQIKVKPPSPWCAPRMNGRGVVNMNDSGHRSIHSTNDPRLSVTTMTRRTRSF